MQPWWNNLTGYTQAMYIIAIASSLVLLVQLVLALFGFGDNVDIDGSAPDAGGADADASDTGGDMDLGAGLRIFTLQTIVSFLVMFGWSGVVFASSAMPVWLQAVLSVLIGALTLLGVAKATQMMMRLQSSGNLDYENAVGLTAQVYIPIPAREQGTGKVSFVFQERFVECDAVTSEAEMLKTNTYVKITAVSGTLLTVRRLGEDEAMQAQRSAVPVNKKKRRK
ncbi:MAG: hypothetical protein FWE62_04270 [Firmicutes bacterium]|nr:hypothetical protein [Bacillota bacterium]